MIINPFQAIILGIVEGITEFLPISSTFHLIQTSKLLGVAQADFTKLFEVFIQSGAILAVVFLYLHELRKNRKLLVYIFISFIPTAIVGFLLYKIIKSFFFESQTLMLTAFLFVGILFILLEFFIKKQKIRLRKKLSSFSFADAFMIGLLQSLAVVPGVSRAGTVMAGMMIAGFKREESAKYSFLLAVPTILAASGFDLLKMKNIVDLDQGNILILLTGFAVSFIVALLSIKWLVSYLQSQTLTLFGIYRIIAAVFLFLL